MEVLGEIAEITHIGVMKVNSPESLETAQKLVRSHGSWSNVREKSRVTRDGVFVVDMDDKAVDEALKRLRRDRAA
ncbi:MAG: hypothetical protein KKC29_08215 [Alphaproteobacteria bacterium]|jgi:hypothetical protein|uniref:Uncharacterized protein n=1 Tax=Brevundimonas aurifodinae TaxID=1508312 RepID=A0ABV1NK84_9CAUL|nr:hypothetical protein [Alphaproteobacteria bacterium]MBU2040848.1 hypothetical protein [Alphaproteobacteria bacterium]MBU2127314.1 hypothetical protein [Alphaproteobacteria bacterium]MBU2207728.1 hypothetical protein [Alphaproteobacteria bacterium]MBU2291072.1 hypothetical protein [Alphaproteobacteria bacterium]